VSPSAPERPDAGEVEGTVRQVGAAVDASSGAVDVRVSVPQGGSWFAGEHVRASIHVCEKTALLAPRSAVLPDDAQHVIFTVKDGKAARHAVDVGIESDQDVEISGKGLAPGDQAVAVGNYELEDGMAVTTAAPPDAKPEAEKAP
jgi:membrane fusion protein, multidrug efflux system